MLRGTSPKLFLGLCLFFLFQTSAFAAMGDNCQVDITKEIPPEVDWRAVFKVIADDNSLWQRVIVNIPKDASDEFIVKEGEQSSFTITAQPYSPVMVFIFERQEDSAGNLQHPAFEGTCFDAGIADGNGQVKFPIHARIASAFIGRHIVIDAFSELEKNRELQSEDNTNQRFLFGSFMFPKETLVRLKKPEEPEKPVGSTKPVDPQLNSCVSPEYASNPKLILSEDRTMQVKLVSSRSAMCTGDFAMYSPEKKILVENYKSNLGRTVPVGRFLKGTEMVYEIINRSELFCHYTCKTSLTPENAKITQVGPDHWTIGWEDRDDGDHNDLVVEVMPMTGDSVCNPLAVSDTSDYVVELSRNAALVSSIIKAWTATPYIPGASWIWSADPIEPLDEETVTFRKTFTLDGTVASSVLKIAADNFFSAKLNGKTVGKKDTDNNWSADTWTQYDVTNLLQTGENILEINVRNMGGIGGPGSVQNPGGLLYRLDNGGDCSANSSPTPTPTVSAGLCNKQSSTNPSLVLSRDRAMQVKLVGNGSPCTGELALANPERKLIVQEFTQNIGKTFNIGNFKQGEELLFEIKNHFAWQCTYDTKTNCDPLSARITVLGPDHWKVEWEDWDKKILYNDLSMEVMPVGGSISDTSPPSPDGTPRSPVSGSSRPI